MVMKPAATLWQELDLLTRLGLGIAPLAAELAQVLRALSGADACALYWLDENGLPEGFFHEDSPRAVQDLFLTEFHRLFMGPDETNVHALARHRGNPLGQLLAPGPAYFRSNTYNLLVRASGHHRTLDLRVEVAGKPRAVVLLFRSLSNHRPFGNDELTTLKRAAPYLERALATAQPPATWSAPPERCGHLVVAPQSENILFMDAEAVELLTEANLLAGAPAGVISAGGSSSGSFTNPAANPVAPSPPEPLAPVARVPDRLRRIGIDGPASLHFPIPGGTLVAEARPLQNPDQTPAAALLVTLTRRQPRPLKVIRHLLATRLSPLQREIALLAGLGHPRGDCGPQLGVSAEALKKHLRVIYAATGTQDWESLGQSLGR